MFLSPKSRDQEVIHPDVGQPIQVTLLPWDRAQRQPVRAVGAHTDSQLAIMSSSVRVDRQGSRRAHLAGFPQKGVFCLHPGSL